MILLVILKSVNDVVIFKTLRNVDGYDDNIGIAKTDSVGQVFAIDEHEIPHTNEITLSNYPNPFNPSTTIQYNIPVNIKKADLEIFNIKGQLIREFKIQNLKLKINEVIWDGKDYRGKKVSAGMYFIYMKTGENINVKKIVKLGL